MKFSLSPRPVTLWIAVLAVSTAIAALIPLERPLPGWVMMWALAAVMWVGFKLLAIRFRGRPHGWRMLAYWMWPGMEADAFRPQSKIQGGPPRRVGAGRGLFRAGLGTLGVCFLAPVTGNPVAAGWCGMVGLLLVLHFGLFDVLADFWNRVGIPVQPLMDSPWKAETLGAFWGARWNRAFSQVTRAAVFRPMVRRFGLVAGTLAGFALSGIAHELVITVPARGGYGLPTLYFLAQGGGVLLERRWFRRGSIAARIWVFAVVLGPAFWLFQPRFMTEVIVPFMRVLEIDV